MYVCKIAITEFPMCIFSLLSRNNMHETFKYGITAEKNQNIRFFFFNKLDVGTVLKRNSL